MKIFRTIIITAIVSGLITSCLNKYSKKDHDRTTKLNEQFYIETYTVSAQGAFGTDMVSQYLTDSATFRKYIGTFDDGPEYFHYRFSGDTVYIEKYHSYDGREPEKLLEKKFLIISDLKRKNKFD